MSIEFDTIEAAPDTGDFLARVGMRVRTARKALRLSRRVLSERSGVSQRYLAQLEMGEGNVSLALLLRIAQALGLRVEQLVAAEPLAPVIALYDQADRLTRQRVLELLDPGSLRQARGERVALVGMRGAGKSTLGPIVAEMRGLPFVELREVIQQVAGIPVTEIIALYGQAGYRQLEARALAQVADRYNDVILAVAGGIADEPDTFETLLARFNTVWLTATPETHIARVREQSDNDRLESEPGDQNPQGVETLRQILASREPLYSRASARLDTTGHSAAQSAAVLADTIGKFGDGSDSAR
ncbi:MAG: shikimate kinase [Pseudomonadota bacterium]